MTMSPDLTAPHHTPSGIPHHTGAPRVLALLDGLMGSNSQTRGVVQALRLPAEECPLAYGKEWPWERLAGYVRLTPETQARLLASPKADLVVSTGRRAGAAARWLKSALRTRDGGMGPKLLHLQDPRFAREAFDLIAAPAHDRAIATLRAQPNVMVVTGAAHPLTAARLTEAAESWRETVTALPRPWIAVLVGGDSGRRRLDAAVATRLAEQASALATRAGGSLLITTSRRTRPDAVAALRAGLESGPAPHRFYAWTPEPSGNPYLGFLGLADGTIATGDSMSMLTEATTTGRPLYIFAPPGWARGPHARYHAGLIEAGVARPLDDETPWATWGYAPVNPARDIARAARALLGLPEAST